MELLTAPVGGTPPVIIDQAALREAISELREGTGPIAIDAERASGYRYSARAYLIQLFRRGGGLHLLDPIALRDLPEIAELQKVIAECESIIHASTQDLSCLREFGLNPQILFDTELGARIANCPRVGLGALCESLLEISLAKEHSAVDWSIRPLRPEWLDYAALDVAVLVDLRDEVAELLETQGKLDWARAEFAHLLKQPPAKPRKDPWRRTSGMHQVKARADLAIVRALWNARDLRASKLDLAPGRLLSDSVIVELALRKPSDEAKFRALPIMRERIRNEVQREHLSEWWSVLQSAYGLQPAEWPELRARGEALPPPRIWRDKFPLAYAHLQHARRLLTEISTTQEIPLENLISPEVVRRITFDDGKERNFNLSADLTEQTRGTLRELGAREWQISLTVDAIAQALTETEPPHIVPEVSE
ncbi:MAG: hypothetical protein RLZZ527_670 [Actinomycetota bacterium]|jgi:ribonuclease D